LIALDMRARIVQGAQPARHSSRLEEKMKQLGIGIGVAFAVALGALTATAGGGGLTGTYEGKLSCVGFNGGSPDRDKPKFDASSPAQITDLGAGRIALRLPGLTDFEVFVQPLTGIPVSGYSSFGGVTCSLDASTQSGAALTAFSRERNGKVKINGVLIRLSEAGGHTSTCSLKLKRVGTTDPGLSGCD
jgi:hypothetical protein